MNPLRLLTLGGLRLEGSAAADRLNGRRKELVLLAYLARRNGRAVPRAELTALLWEEKDEVRARHSLRQALHNLRQALGEGLEVGPDRVRLGEGVVELDATAFESEVAAGQLREAAARWQGDFLPGTEDAGGEVYRGWLEAERERLRRQLGWTLERLTGEAREQGAWREGVQWAERWAERFPFDEAAHRVLVEALRLAGRQAEAAARHADFATRLRLELGTEPSAAFLLLRETLQASGTLTGTTHSGPPRPGAALFTPDLIGREAAFAELVAAWRAAEAGEGVALLLEGEEGIGKTRLCQEFVRWIDSRGQAGLILQAAAFEGDDEAPHSTLRRALASLPGAPGLAGAPDPALAELSTLVPALRQRFARLPPASGAEAALDAALHQVLRDVGAEVPVVLLLDDVPAADPASLTLLLSLARDPPASTLLVLTGRPDRLAATGRASRLRSLPHLRRLRLAPLGEAETEALLGSMVALPADERRALAYRLHAETGGTPLYTVELVRALAEEGVLALDAAGGWRLAPELAARSLPLPSRLGDAMRERLDRLDAATRTLLDAAAMLGPRVEAAALEAATRLPAPEFARALDELIARRFLCESDADEVYRFTHEILRRLVLERLTPGRRRTLAADAAEADAPVVVDAPGSPAAGLPEADVVVLPFEAAGAPELRLVADGMPDLLAVALDGSGGLRFADPQLVLDRLDGADVSASPVAHAHAVATGLGARWFVLGRLLAHAGQVRLVVRVFSTAEPAEPPIRIVLDRPETELLGLLDQAAVELVLRLAGAQAPELLTLVRHPTASLAALRAFLEAEAALRHSELDSAIDRFRAAIVHDPGFALAHYRLAHALEWTYQPDSPRLVVEAVLAAARFADRLPERLRTLVRARHAALRGAGEEAVRLYRSVLAVAPHDVDAWYGLGCTIFHYAPLWGGRTTEAREPFERALALEPEHLGAAVHLASVAALEGRRDELSARTEALLRRGQRSVHVSLDLLLRMQLAYALPDPELQEGVLAELRVGRENDVSALLVFPFLVGDDLDAAARAIALFTEPGQPASRRATGHALLAALELARGRVGTARQQLERSERLDPNLALACAAWLALSPLVNLPAGELEALRTRLGGSAKARDDGEPAFLVPPHAELDHLLLPYLDAALAAALGDGPSVEAAVRTLEAAEPPSGMPTLGPGLAQRLRARVAAVADDPAAALAALEESRPEVPWHWLVASGVLSGAQERFLRAEQCLRLGRRDEARCWFGASVGLSPFDVVLAAPVALRLGELAEADGELHEAVRHYRRFLELWSECDTGLRWRVEEVTRRLEAIERRLDLVPGVQAPAAIGAAPADAISRRLRAAAAALLVLVPLVAAAGLFARAKPAPPAAPAVLPVLAVGHLQLHAGEQDAGSAATLADLLATNLARVPELEVLSGVRLLEIAQQLGVTADDRTALARAARQAGAGELLEGSLYRRPDGGLRLELQRVELQTGRIRGAYQLAGTDLFELVDRATAELAEAFGAPAGSLRIADVTTRSPAALAFYQRGIRGYVEGNMRGAQQLFEAALEEDSTFAMAAYYLWNTKANLGTGTEAEHVRLLRLADRAPDRERLLLRAQLMVNEPEKLAIAETLAVRYPSEPAGHLLYGNAIVFSGDFLGGIPHLRRALDMDSLSLAGTGGRCLACDALEAMAAAYQYADSVPAAERVMREWVRRQPKSARAWKLLGVILEVQNRVEEAAAAHQMAVSLHPVDSYDLVHPASRRIRIGEFATADRLLHDVLAHGSADARRAAYGALIISLRNQGRLREALELFEPASRQRAGFTGPIPWGLENLRAQVLLEMGRGKEAALRFEAHANVPHHMPGEVARRRSWNMTLYAHARASAGDTAGLAALADSLEAWGRGSAFGRDRLLHHHVRGLLHGARSEPQAAAASFQGGIFSRTLGTAHTSVELAKTLLVLGRSPEAIEILRPLFAGPLGVGHLHVTHTELHELLGRAWDAAGQPDSAAAHYRWVLNAWKDADPRFHARRDSIAERLRALDWKPAAPRH